MQDGRMPVRLRLAFMTGWAPAESQPKPLAPGSGRISLVDVLSERPGESEAANS